MLFFGLSTWVLALGLFGVVVGATAIGHAIGKSKRDDEDGDREPFAVLQAALIGFMGLVIAFGISLAVGRYESRRADVVTESNAIGTSYLRAQTLDEPVRTKSLDLLRTYTDTSIRLSDTVPGSSESQEVVAQSGRLQSQLWALADTALRAAPTASAPRLYVESLNDTFDTQSARVYGLQNRVPTAVLILEVAGAALALGALALHLATLGRGYPTVLLAAMLVAVTLLVTFDLDRPARGLIVVPADPLIQTRASMSTAPAAVPPG